MDVVGGRMGRVGSPTRPAHVFHGWSRIFGREEGHTHVLNPRSKVQSHAHVLKPRRVLYIVGTYENFTRRLAHGVIGGVGSRGLPALLADTFNTLIRILEAHGRHACAELGTRTIYSGYL